MSINKTEILKRLKGVLDFLNNAYEKDWITIFRAMLNEIIDVMEEPIMPDLKFWKIVPWHEALLWLQQNEDKTICIGDSGREYDWTDFEYDLSRALNLSNFLWFIPKEEGKENA